MTAANGGAHVLVYPYPSSGHIIPLLDLTHQFLTRGLTVTVIVTPENNSLLDPLKSCHVSSSLHTLVLPSPEPDLTFSKIYLVAHMKALRDLHAPLISEWFDSQESPPVTIISDFFHGWTHELATNLGVPRVTFSPSGALSYCVDYHLWRDLPENELGEDPDYTVSFPGIPNLPKCPWFQLSYLYRTLNKGDPDWEFCRSMKLTNATSWGIVFNSFTELERVYLDYVKKITRHDMVWAVGPVLPPDNETLNRGGSSSMPRHELMTWLDKRESHSVVYVCFGSRAVLTRKQIGELAGGMEKSGVYFVWCVAKKNLEPNRVASDDDDDDLGLLPRGYEDRVAGKGLIIKGWAPQMEILRHASVGAFLTHCGWNSTLEGIAAGVVMLTWPMSADQFTNADLLVDELGVGIRVGEATQVIPKSTELARILTESVDENLSEAAKAEKLREQTLGAVVKGGSSDKALDEFVKRVNQLSEA
jgi:phage terminase large subunit-like protein